MRNSLLCAVEVLDAGAKCLSGILQAPGVEEEDDQMKRLVAINCDGCAAEGLIALALAVSLSTPAIAADPVNGERLAEQWCAACHVVTNAQRQANADAPPFEEIAKRPGFSESGLTTFLLDPHAKMPNMDLTRFEAGDIVAYIATLR
jgi:mono/diheme cytochrome c family protein